MIKQYLGGKIVYCRFGRETILSVFGARFRTVKTWREHLDSLRRYALYLQVWPVYYAVWSRDCDHMEVDYACQWPTYWHMVQGWKEMARHAEGPIRFRRISRRQFREFETSSRDIAAERAGY